MIDSDVSLGIFADGSDEPFNRYARELAWLDTEPDSLAPLVSRVATQRAWTTAPTSWTRCYGSFSPQLEPFGVFVYESAASPHRICLAELFVSRPEVLNEPAKVVIETPAGWIKLSPLGCDPRLGTLALVLARYPTAEVLRYRPYRRCTLRVRSSDAATRFVKVFSDDQGASVHENTVAVWQARQRGELSFNVAPPVGWEAQSRSLSLGFVPGEPILHELLSANGAALSVRMGRACAEIAVSEIKPVSVFDAAAQMRRSRKYAEHVKSALPQLSERIDALLNRLAAVHSAAGQRMLRPIHGSPHAHQWLQQGTTLGLVDFDRFGLGDPELDVATFLGEMDFERKDRSPVEAISRAYQQGYESVYGPLEPGLIAAYRTHKRFAKVRRAAYTPSPMAPKKALRHLARAEACLEI